MKIIASFSKVIRVIRNEIIQVLQKFIISLKKVQGTTMLFYMGTLLIDLTNKSELIFWKYKIFLS